MEVKQYIKLEKWFFFFLLQIFRHIQTQEVQNNAGFFFPKVYKW